jgi:hypothetical protein
MRDSASTVLGASAAGAGAASPNTDRALKNNQLKNMYFRFFISFISDFGRYRLRF